MRLVDIGSESIEKARKVVRTAATNADTVRVVLAERARRRRLGEMMTRIDAGALSDLDDPSVVHSAQR
jgi:hypothetical protein